MQSALWAGRRRAGQPARIVLTAGFGEASSSNDVTAEAIQSYQVEAGVIYSYRTEAGLPATCVPDAFPLEPQIKEEALFFHHRGRATKLLERRGPAVMARDREGNRVAVSRTLLASETALGTFDEPPRFPEVHALRQTMLDWRFYHSLRTDVGCDRNANRAWFVGEHALRGSAAAHRRCPRRFPMPEEFC